MASTRPPRVSRACALSALSLAAAAGAAPGEIPVDLPGHPAPYTKPGPLIGHLYVKPATGEMVFTPADEYQANKSRGLRDSGTDINGDGSPDCWIATNTDICVPTPLSSGIATGVGVLDDPPMAIGDFHHYKAQFDGTDNLVSTIQFTFWTDLVDVDLNADGFGDGLDGKGLEITFWDREDVFGQASSVCPVGTSGTGALTRAGVVRYSFTRLPGPLTAPAQGELAGMVVAIDLSGGSEMELLDSDGFGPASGFFNPGIATADVLDPFDLDSDMILAEPDGLPDGDTDGNGTWDWSYSFRAIQPTATVMGGTGTPAVGRIGYALAAYGVHGTGGTIEITPTGTGATTPPFGLTTDGIADYFNRIDNAPETPDHTRIIDASLIEPMGTAFPFLSAVVPSIPSRLQRYSLFRAASAETPSPTQVPGGAPLCEGLPTTDFAFFGQQHDTNGDTVLSAPDIFVGGLNCAADIATDTDGDTIVDTAQDGIVDGQPSALGYLALGSLVVCTCDNICPCDVDGDDDLDVDDIEAFVVNFIDGIPGNADFDGDFDEDPDDIMAFVDCFVSPPPDCPQ